MELIANGIWQLVGYPRHWLNAYLVDDVLIDTATRWAKNRVLRQLKGRSVRMVALTHCHPDHQGSAKFVCEHFQASLACHEADRPAVEGRSPMVPNNGALRLGVRLWAGPPNAVTRVLHDGDYLGGMRVVHAPGHTPGHILFFRESDRVCIAGDVLANVNFLTGKAGLREPPALFSVDAEQNRRSLQTLLALKPRIVCFGHGPPLRDISRLEEFVARRSAAPYAARNSTS
jgi:glyoxylase-like metal-dependent hydrolase (beta-lactamase superfamily II)